MKNSGDDKMRLTKRGKFFFHFKLSLKAYYGLISFLMAVLGVVLFVFFTLIVEKVPGKLDMTREKVYSLSDESKKILDELKQPLRIELIWQKDLETQYDLHDLYTQVDAFLKQYSQYSKYVNYRVIDPLSYPDVVASYYVHQQSEKIEHGSLVVASTDSIRVLPAESWSGYRGTKRVKLNVESPVSNAIVYVMDGKVSKIYSTVGHREFDVSMLVQSTGKTFFETLGERNIEVLPLNLEISKIPEDADGLIILSPLGDFSSQEISILVEFMKRKGRLWINLAYTKSHLTRLGDFLEDYDLVSKRGIVMETGEKYLLPNLGDNPLYFLVQRHNFPGDIADGNDRRSDSPIIMGNALVLEKSEKLKSHTRIYPLISTSVSTFLFDRGMSDKFSRTGKFTFTDKKEMKSFNIAYAVIDSKSEEQLLETDFLHLVITTGEMSLMSRFSGTSQFYIDVVSWLVDEKDRIHIPSKNLSNASLYLTSKTVTLLSLFFVIVVPTFFIVAGIMVWNRRKYM